jgi:uncharacterized membrane protein YfcA
MLPVSEPAAAGTLMEFSPSEVLIIALIFVWTGFVRSGIGFGGAALGLPMLLLVENAPLFFLPIIALHLIVFTAITSGGRLGNIDWPFVRHAMGWMIVPKIIGVIGLLSLPTDWLGIFVFVVTAFYALTWILQREIRSNAVWVDRVLLLVGGYVSGASLVGAPLIAAVAVRRVELTRYRDTLFVLWFMLVVIKLGALLAAGVDPQWRWALALLLPAALGHVIGLRFHEHLVHGNPAKVKRVLGGLLLLVSGSGIAQYLVPQ